MSSPLSRRSLSQRWEEAVDKQGTTTPPKPEQSTSSLAPTSTPRNSIKLRWEEREDETTTTQLSFSLTKEAQMSEIPTLVQSGLVERRVSYYEELFVANNATEGELSATIAEALKQATSSFMFKHHLMTHTPKKRERRSDVERTSFDDGDGDDDDDDDGDKEDDDEKWGERFASFSFSPSFDPNTIKAFASGSTHLYDAASFGDNKEEKEQHLRALVLADGGKPIALPCGIYADKKVGRLLLDIIAVCLITDQDECFVAVTITAKQGHELDALAYGNKRFAIFDVDSRDTRWGKAGEGEAEDSATAAAEGGGGGGGGGGGRRCIFEKVVDFIRNPNGKASLLSSSSRGSSSSNSSSTSSSSRSSSRSSSIRNSSSNILESGGEIGPVVCASSSSDSLAALATTTAAASSSSLPSSPEATSGVWSEVMTPHTHTHTHTLTNSHAHTHARTNTHTNTHTPADSEWRDVLTPVVTHTHREGNTHTHTQTHDVSNHIPFLPHHPSSLDETKHAHSSSSSTSSSSSSSLSSSSSSSPSSQILASNKGNKRQEVLQSGWLFKWPARSQRVGFRTKRWFELTGNTLSYYKHAPPVELDSAVSKIDYLPVYTLELSHTSTVRRSRKYLYPCIRVQTDRDVLWLRGEEAGGGVASESRNSSNRSSFSSSVAGGGGGGSDFFVPGRGSSAGGGAGGAGRGFGEEEEEEWLLAFTEVIESCKRAILEQAEAMYDIMVQPEERGEEGEGEGEEGGDVFDEVPVHREDDEEEPEDDASKTRKPKKKQ